MSLAEVRTQLDALELKCERMPVLCKLQRSEVTANYKQLMTSCNSLAIVFLQYELIQEALDVLRKAAKADLKMYEKGTLLDRIWPGRITTYNCLAYLFQK